jgi:hypothetical protein
MRIRIIVKGRAIIGDEIHNKISSRAAIPSKT